MKSNDPRKLLVTVVKTLNKLKIPYLVTGGIAVLVWGRPRFTADIDIVVELDRKNANLLGDALMALGQAGYIDSGAVARAIESEGEFNFIHGETGVKVDFWVFRKNDDFDVSRFERRKVETIAGERVYFISPEDLILTKLKWHKESGSARQMEDVESILKISGGKLDLSYLKKWAVKFDVWEPLERLNQDVCTCGSGKKYKKCHGA